MVVRTVKTSRFELADRLWNIPLLTCGSSGMRFLLLLGLVGCVPDTIRLC